MRRKVLALAAVASLLVWRRRAGRRAREPITAGERPGWRYAIGRLKGMIAPPVEILPSPPAVRFERDVEVAVRNGTILRVNVFRPERGGRYPVIMCAHPYGKDNLPQRGHFGYRPAPQYRMLRQPEPLSFSAWTSWEAPDPAYWVRHGYVVVNCDLRGFGASDGVGSLLTDAEGRDYFDLIEWAGTRPWSNGRVGLNGVSYLALSQYGTAALRPPHLAGICPWEGFSDVYRDFARPGGIREDGFMRLWNAGIRRGGRNDEDLRRGQIDHPLRDGWWAARTPDLEKIEVPILVCGSFSDHTLHSRGRSAPSSTPLRDTAGSTRTAAAGGPHTTPTKPSPSSAGSSTTSSRARRTACSRCRPCAWRSARTATRSTRYDTRRRGRCRGRAGPTCTCARTVVSPTRRRPWPARWASIWVRGAPASSRTCRTMCRS